MQSTTYTALSSVTAAPRRASRSGISLIEVLISVFILSVGLLGAAALLPVGEVQIFDAVKADRSANCGRAAFREIKTRRMVDPSTWLLNDGTPVLANQQALTALQSAQPFVIDPLLIGWAWRQRYPYPPTDPQLSVAMTFPYASAAPMRVWRVSIDAGALSPAGRPAMAFGMAERIFRWGDDLVFDLPTDRGARPRPMIEYATVGADGKQLVQPDPNPWPNTNALRQQTNGNYSWLITVSPAETEVNVYSVNKRLYEVSVAVFYNRDLPDNWTTATAPTLVNPAPNERVAPITVFDGWGGGDAELVMPGMSPPSGMTAEEFAQQYLKVRKNRWILLMGEKQSQYATRQVLKWYRVVAAADKLTGLTSRSVTLAGPDIPPSGANNQYYAVLFNQELLGVYTRVMSLDTGAFVEETEAAGRRTGAQY